MSIQGRGKTGKTRLAATAPGIQCIQSTEHGWDGVIQQVRPDDWKTYYRVADYYAIVDLSADELFREGDRPGAERAADAQANRMQREVVKPWADDARAAFADEAVRTIVWDLAGEFNEYIRLANFGKLEKNPQMAYGPVNMEYKNLIRLAHRYRKNLILIHEVKQRYKTVTDPQTGKDKNVEVPGEVKRQGNESTDYLVHSFVQAHYTPPLVGPGNAILREHKFEIEILRARLNAPANGMKLEIPDWTTLMMFLAPAVPTEAWQ